MIAQVNIKAHCKNGIICLGESFFTPPFKIATITENRKAGLLDLMLMNSSPGILDEDDYELKIDIKENASLRLHTQSYQRLFTMKKGARQSMETRIAAGASFTYLPHPSVPHEHSIFKSINKIYIAPGGKLTWGEVL